MGPKVPHFWASSEAQKAQSRPILGQNWPKIGEIWLGPNFPAVPKPGLESSLSRPDPENLGNLGQNLAQIFPKFGKIFNFENFPGKILRAAKFCDTESQNLQNFTKNFGQILAQKFCKILPKFFWLRARARPCGRTGARAPSRPRRVARAEARAGSTQLATARGKAGRRPRKHAEPFGAPKGPQRRRSAFFWAEGSKRPQKKGLWGAKFGLFKAKFGLLFKIFNFLKN